MKVGALLYVIGAFGLDVGEDSGKKKKEGNRRRSISKTKEMFSCQNVKDTCLALGNNLWVRSCNGCWGTEWQMAPHHDIPHTFHLSEGTCLSIKRV